MKKIVVIYHRADFDGRFCREIARKFLGDRADYIGWDYGDEPPDLSPYSPTTESPNYPVVYMLDISIDGLMDYPELVWIDHHKSAIEKYPATIDGYRIDGVAACRLVWQWFIRDEKMIAAAHEINGARIINPALPEKQDFIDRTVSEPLAVRLAGEYDIWDKRDPDAEVFQFGLRSTELTPEKWNWLLVGDTGPDQAIPKRYNTVVLALLADGKRLQAYQRRNDALAMKASFIVEWEGLKFLALNTQAKSSLAFASRDVLETGHDALLRFSFNGEMWDCSMYHARHNAGIDLSAIAVKYGGGGHRGACGFRKETIPFNISGKPKTT